MYGHNRFAITLPSNQINFILSYGEAECLQTLPTGACSASLQQDVAENICIPLWLL